MYNARRAANGSNRGFHFAVVARDPGIPSLLLRMMDEELE
jgi:hypothetical protein